MVSAPSSWVIFVRVLPVYSKEKPAVIPGALMPLRKPLPQVREVDRPAPSVRLVLTKPLPDREICCPSAFTIRSRGFALLQLLLNSAVGRVKILFSPCLFSIVASLLPSVSVSSFPS